MIVEPNIHGLLFFAQDPPAPGEAIAVDPAAGTGDGTGGPAKSSGRTELILPLLALMIVFTLVFSILGQRRERKKREALVSAVRKHDKVQTIGGVIGSIVEVTDDEVTLKVDESSNTRIRFARSAVQQVLDSGRSGAASKTDAKIDAK